jgi:hypothetical protein
MERATIKGVFKIDQQLDMEHLTDYLLFFMVVAISLVAAQIYGLREDLRERCERLDLQRKEDQYAREKTNETFPDVRSR